ncbi:hypothetical protein F4825DRAFT_443334 [Nemania diffusa]|nr:hypothetical protein F4825DRAFT_443334 [Nemania diffusa]
MGCLYARFFSLWFSSFLRHLNYGRACNPRRVSGQYSSNSRTLAPARRKWTVAVLGREFLGWAKNGTQSICVWGRSRI